MEIEQQIWGATSEGEAVVLYTLRNAAGAEVRLCNVGAAVVSILVPDRDGHLADVALGYKDFRSYFGDPALCGKSIGRVAGCIAYGTMRIDGEEYRLDINGMALVGEPCRNQPGRDVALFRRRRSGVSR